MFSLIPRSWLLGLLGGAFLLSNGWTAWKMYSVTSNNLTQYYGKKIAHLRQENDNFKVAIEEIQIKEAEANEALEKARKAGEAVKPLDGLKSDERLRRLRTYPGCRDCK